VTLKERFWNKVDIRGIDECWEWLGGKTGSGYGAIRRGRKREGMELAHRAAWTLVNGDIPDKMQVCHHCDNKGCVNPLHLFLGTQADNVSDMVRKRRQNKGENHGRAKLTRDQVIAIREEYAGGGISQRKLAARYHVDRALIWGILSRKLWRHV